MGSVPVSKCRQQNTPEGSSEVDGNTVQGAIRRRWRPCFVAQPAGMAEGSWQGPVWAPPGQAWTLGRGLEPQPAWALQQEAHLTELRSVLQESNFFTLII